MTSLCQQGGQLLLGAEEFIILVDVAEFILFLNAEDLILLINTEEDDKILSSSSTTYAHQRGGQTSP